MAGLQGRRQHGHNSNLPQAIILADQSVLDTIPSTTNKQCLKIPVLIVENGTLKELTDEFLRLLGNRRVPKGSNVLLCSAS
jgi:hypothetical protein